MRYVKGCINVSPKQDYPLLRRLLHCGFATHGQLFEFMRAGGHESSRWSFNWRVRRLVAHGLVVRYAVPCIGKAFVYAITPAGAFELAGAGERFVIAPANTDRDGKELRVAHAIELNNIHLSLLRAGLLARWVPEAQIRSRNAVESFTHTKDYDAIVTVRLENRDATFGLEYERTAKSETHYATIVGKFESEQKLDRFLYLTSSEDVLRFVSWQFRNCKRQVCFGLLTDWYARLLDMVVFDWLRHEYRPLRTALAGGTLAGEVPVTACR